MDLIQGITPPPLLLIVVQRRLATDAVALDQFGRDFRARHASTGRVALSRVSGSIYFDLKSPDLQQVLEKIASSHDIAATLDSLIRSSRNTKSLRLLLLAPEKGGRR